jgi:hypothetical protein
MPQNKNLTQICFSIRGFGRRYGVIYARKKPLAREVSKRYQNAGKKEKAGMLDELVKTTGYNRKYVLHVLANWGEAVSPPAIDRVLKPEKKKPALKGKSGTKPGKLLKKQIPVRAYYADSDKKPGVFEIDTVHRCGASDSGEFCLTLTAADLYSGWVELRPTLNKAHKWAFEALRDIKSPSRSLSWA